MKVLYEEGVAIHFGPSYASTASDGRGPAEAGLAEVRTGAVMSSEIIAWECRPYTTVGKATWAGAITQVPVQLRIAGQRRRYGIRAIYQAGELIGTTGVSGRRDGVAYSRKHHGYTGKAAATGGDCAGN